VKRHGTWTYQARLGTDPLTGRPIRRKKGGFRTRREAIEARAGIVTEAAEGQLVNDHTLTVGRWLSQWAFAKLLGVAPAFKGTGFILHVSNRQKSSGVSMGRADADEFETYLAIGRAVSVEGLAAVGARCRAEADRHRAMRP
jgi:hypothetical protein